jgi:hypothetical protein
MRPSNPFHTNRIHGDHTADDTVLYRWQGLLVTERWFHADGQWYPLTELYHLTLRTGPVQAGRRRAFRVISAITVAVALALMVALPSLLAGLGTSLSLMLAGAGVGLSLRRWPRPMMLCASYRGLPVVLFASTDHIEFHKVCRALRRAVERHEEHMLARSSTGSSG